MDRTPRELLVTMILRGLFFGLPLGAVIAGFVALKEGSYAAVLFALLAAVCAAAELLWPERGALKHDIGAWLLCFPLGGLVSWATVAQLSYAESNLRGGEGPTPFERALDAPVAVPLVLGGLFSGVLGVSGLTRRRGRPGRDGVLATAGMFLVAFLIPRVAAGSVRGLVPMAEFILLSLGIGALIVGAATLADRLAARLAPAPE